jgi:RNA polymerase sigma factor (sigma-70 family)
MMEAVEAVTAPHEWPESLVDLYAAERLGFVRLAYLMTGDREIAQEVVQDAFMAARRAWPSVREGRPYVRTAIVNRCHSWGRRQQLEVAHRARPQPSEESSAEVDELWDALSRLNPRQRAAVVLRYYEDLADADIAELLNCRPATVRTSIHRALNALRKEITR